MAENQPTPVMPASSSHEGDNWFLQGACRTSALGADAWFPPPTDTASGKYARLVCSTCTVLERCRQAASAFPGTVGIWAGEDELDRYRRQRRDRRRA